MRSKIIVSVVEKKEKVSMPALHAACRDGNYDAVVTLIEKNGG